MAQSAPPKGYSPSTPRVGAQTVENGYQAAYGIALVPGEGGSRARPGRSRSVAGGICQVSTTLFHGVFTSGLPIEERNWHLYWPVRLRPALQETGMPGPRPTVDDQSGLDFRFCNFTGSWLAIQAVADGEWVRDRGLRHRSRLVR